MAVTKVLARNGSVAAGIRYILNGDKTQGHVLTAHLNCDPGREARQMGDTKEATGKTDGVQYYHMILSFKPGEIAPKMALQIGKELAEEHLPGYETVIAVHTDKQHIHCHLIWNSVNAETGEKYHSSAKTYYSQIRATADRLCRKYGLSVILTGDSGRSVSYVEWLRQSRGQPTFRSMLEADLRDAIDSADSLGEFYMIMENLGYEIKHGSRLGFRLRGQTQFMIPGRRNPLFTEDGILAAIEGNLADMEAGRPRRTVSRPPFPPYRKRPKYTGIMALYVHYLYILGKIGKRQYPPRMTPQLRKDLTRFEKIRAHADFLRKNSITSQEGLEAYRTRTEEMLNGLMKQRTILNVRKKKRRKLYSALTDVTALAEAKTLYEDGVTGMEAEYQRYYEAVNTLEQSGVSRDSLAAEKSALYEDLAQLNRQIRAVRKTLAMCGEIREKMTEIERTIHKTDPERAVPTRSKANER